MNQVKDHSTPKKVRPTTPVCDKGRVHPHPMRMETRKVSRKTGRYDVTSQELICVLALADT